MRLCLIGLLAFLALPACAQIPEPKPVTAETRTPGVPPVPLPRPDFVASAQPKATPGAFVCKDPRLTGTRIDNVVGPIAGCAIYQPVRLSEISGIKLSNPAKLDCRTARTFANWLTGVADVEARRTLGARIEKVWLMGTYSCRTRNSRPGARLSEHAVGRAVDVGGIWLSNGRKITIAQNWGKGSAGAFLHTIWKKACGTFKTVLGPGSDRFHQDHLHLDTALRKRSFCR